MIVQIIEKMDSLWLLVAEYAETCSWDACKGMAASMKNGDFSDWERIIAAVANDAIMGFCALVKPQDFPGSEYTPLIKWLFVDEKFRGRRISQKLLNTASEYANELGYKKIFLTTWHIGLYEKYGFIKICDKEKRPGYFEGIYELKIQ